MSRALKFRAWNNELKKFVCWYQQGLSMIGDTGQLYLSGSMNVTDKFTLSQYTGLKDKNNKEIYDGDVIGLEEMKIIITYENGSFQMIARRDQGKSPAIQERVCKFKVIGNIYENPELVNK